MILSLYLALDVRRTDRRGFELSVQEYGKRHDITFGYVVSSKIPQQILDRLWMANVLELFLYEMNYRF